MKELNDEEIEKLFQLFLDRKIEEAKAWWLSRAESESIHNLGIKFEVVAMVWERGSQFPQGAVELYCLAGFCWELAWWLNETPGVGTFRTAACCYQKAGTIFNGLPDNAEFEGGPDVRRKLRNILS